MTENAENSEKPSWFQQNPKKTIVLFTFSSIAILMLVIELVLRILGFHPGVYNDTGYFYGVDSLIMYKEYMADENGIMKISPYGRYYVDSVTHTWPKGENDDVYSDVVSDKDNEWAVKRLALDYCELNSEINFDNTFLNWVHELEKRPDSSLNDFEQAAVDYYRLPVNTDGFRSIELKQYSGNRKKVMLIGDSFTWGLSAEPLTSCFADQLLTRGYVVYNLGIVGVDPAQYMAVAQKYIPELKPDVVIVNFFRGNDIMYHYREPKPYQLPIYPTNAGWLVADRLTEYMTPEEAYRYIRTQIEIPDQDKKSLNWFLGKTVIGSRVWLILKKLDMVPHTSDEFLEEHNAYWSETRSKNIIGEVYFKEIQKVSGQNNCEYIFTMIEDRPVCNPYLFGIEPDEIFKEVPYHICEDLKDEHYNPCPDGHLNNEGHKVFTDFLQNKIDSILAAKAAN